MTMIREWSRGQTRANERIRVKLHLFVTIPPFDPNRAGKARQAAEYAAYAAVYGQGGYGAVSDRESFEPEFQWQAACLASLAGQSGAST